MRVLVVEDEKNIANALNLGLSRNGYAVDIAETGRTALDCLMTNSYDLMLLDLNFPDMDGLEVCKAARENDPALLILMLTARGNKADVVKGLDYGADDYLVKPYHFDVLLARIRALLRRDMRVRKPVLKIQDISLDPIEKVVWKSNHRVQLTRKEFGILEYLMRHPGEVISQEELLDHVWGKVNNVFSNTVRVHIQSLRRKLGDDTKTPKYIKTEIGIGYRFLTQQHETEE